MDQPPVIARAGPVVWPQTVAVPVSTPVTSTWAQQATTAPPHTVTNQTTNKNNNRNKNNSKYIMPNINNTKSSKSPNSDIANSPSDNMKTKIINFIRAGYPGLYLVSHEEQRVALEMTRIAQELKYNLVFWSVVDGLVDTQKGVHPAHLPPLEHSY
jgi:hypothetical protein